MLIVVSGLPATGKSAVAASLARRLGATWLSIDPIEAAMLRSGIEAGWMSGVAAYEVAGRVAAENLALGGDVVVDAVNDSEIARDTWRRAVGATKTPIAWLETICSDDVTHRQRLTGRHRDVDPIPEPTWDDVRRRRENYAPWRETCLVLDSTQRLDDLVDQAARYIRQLPTTP